MQAPSTMPSDWDESKHPRKRDGKFAPKGRGEAGGTKDEDYHRVERVWCNPRAVALSQPALPLG